jgi:TPR repeat protein
MEAPVALLKFIAKASLSAVGAGVVADFVEVLPDIARDVWSWWGKDKNDAQRRAEIQELAGLPPPEARKAVDQAVAEVASDQPAAVRAQLANFVGMVPGAVHLSLRRPDDPRGVTVPANLPLQRAEDLIPFLPQRMPRFKPGDRPLVGVDRELVKLLGVGGFGEVWRARNPHFPDLPNVALKFCLDPTAREQLLRHEAALLARVMKQGALPGIVPLRQTYLSAETPCLEYDFIEGGDLASAIYAYRERNGPLEPGMATKIVLKLARSVGQLHQLSPPIVHRDLKPANVLARQKDKGTEFLITDFGIGGLVASQSLEQTRQGTTSHPMMTALHGAHTPLYASPQQKRGDPPDPRDDVHALGILWYQLLIGDFSQGAPAGGRWRQALLQRGLIEPLLLLLESCFETEAEHRPANAAVLAGQIQAILYPELLSTETALFSSRNPTVYGEAVTFTATLEAPPHAAGPPPGTVTFKDGEIEVGTAALSSGVATLTTTALAAGSHLITASYSGDARFTSSASAPLAQTVSPAPLTITANDASKVQGQGNPDFTANYRGFVNGENETCLDGALRFTTPATDNSPAGSYPVTPGGLTASNYNITFVDGTLKVSAKESRCEQDMRDALEEWRTRGTEDAYFERQGPSRIVVWQTAALEGDTVAQWLLARCLQEGTGVKKDPPGAVSWLRRAAEGGLAVAQNDLGECYFGGEGVEKDHTEAFRWYTGAAEQGFAEAQRNLGVCHAEGAGVPRDPVEAARRFRRAAEQGWVEAQCNLGDCYFEGTGVLPDPTEAVRWYRLAAESGYAEAQNDLGDCYQEGEGTEEDLEEAARWYRKAAEQGHPGGQFNLGCCYLHGKGVEEDLAEAVRLLRQAAGQGDTTAQIVLGGCHLRGKGVEPDENAAVAWYRKAASQGDAIAQRHLGDCYLEGVGGEKNAAKAADWYRKAAKAGDVPAMVRLGLRYELGEGATQNFAKAEQWYRQAAGTGDPDGQESLGRCYFYGYGVEQDYPQAISWYRQAAGQGSANAQASLGACYDSGEGVKRDQTEAAKWYEKAAKQGHVEARVALGLCYETGRGVEQNLAKAVKWYRKAADQGSRKARNALQRLAPTDRASEAAPAAGADDAPSHAGMPDDETRPGRKRKIRNMFSSLIASGLLTKGETVFSSENQEIGLVRDDHIERLADGAKCINFEQLTGISARWSACVLRDGQLKTIGELRERVRSDPSPTATTVPPTATSEGTSAPAVAARLHRPTKRPLTPSSDFPTADEYRAALVALRDQTTPNHRLLLRNLYRAPGHTATIRQLAEQVGYADFRGGNLLYGLLASQLCEALDVEIEGENVHVLATFKREPGIANGELQFVMRPQLAEALETLGWV